MAVAYVGGGLVNIVHTSPTGQTTPDKQNGGVFFVMCLACKPLCMQGLSRTHSGGGVALVGGGAIHTTGEVRGCCQQNCLSLEPTCHNHSKAIMLTVTFQSELFLPNLISLEFNSPLFPFLYFCSFTLEVSLQQTINQSF